MFLFLGSIWKCLLQTQIWWVFVQTAILAPNPFFLFNKIQLSKAELLKCINVLFCLKNHVNNTENFTKHQWQLLVHDSFWHLSVGTQKVLAFDTVTDKSRSSAGAIAFLCCVCSCGRASLMFAEVFSHSLQETPERISPVTIETFFSVSRLSPLTCTFRDAHNLECSSPPASVWRRSVGRCDAYIILESVYLSLI